MTTPDWAQKARDMTLANCSSDHCRAVGRGCGCYETNIAALREAYERGAADAATVAEGVDETGVAYAIRRALSAPAALEEK